ncbi:MAG: LysR family transcriptional regulator [Peptococcaceae bacterium]
MLKQFYFVLALEKYRSFSKAAKKIGISQSALSTTIRNLEKELGYDIFIRTNRSLEFTERGNFVLEKIYNIEMQLKNIRNIKYTLQSQKQALLISGGTNWCNMLLTDALIKILRIYPEIEVSLEKCSNLEVISGVVLDKIDFGLIQISDIDENFYMKEIEKRHLNYTKLFSDEMCFLVGRYHPLFREENVFLSDILKCSYITDEFTINSFVLNFLKKNGYDKDFFYVNDVSSQRKLISNSDCVAVMPKSLAKASNDIYKENLHSLNIIDYKWNCEIGYVHDGNLNKIEKEFIEILSKATPAFNKL